MIRFLHHSPRLTELKNVETDLYEESKTNQRRWKTQFFKRREDLKSLESNGTRLQIFVSLNNEEETLL